MVDRIDMTVIAPTTSGPRLSLSQGTASMQIERVAEREANIGNVSVLLLMMMFKVSISAISPHPSFLL